MKRSLLCPRTELCVVYRIYVDKTEDDSLGVIKASTIDQHDYYSCTALSTVMELIKEGEIPEETANRLHDSPGCLLIDQGNKSTKKTRHDT